MSESDKYDEQAERLLPCDTPAGEICSFVHLNGHFPSCAAYFRPAVAAALREQAARIEELELALVLIGERAVVDWDNEVVGEVDRLVPHGAKYKDVLAAMLKRKGGAHGTD